MRRKMYIFHMSSNYKYVIDWTKYSGKLDIASMSYVQLSPGYRRRPNHLHMANNGHTTTYGIHVNDSQ